MPSLSFKPPIQVLPSNKGAEWQLHSAGIVSVSLFLTSHPPAAPLCSAALISCDGPAMFFVLSLLLPSLPAPSLPRSLPLSLPLRLINNTVLAILAFPPLALMLPCFGPISSASLLAAWLWQLRLGLFYSLFVGNTLPPPSSPTGLSSELSSLHFSKQRFSPSHAGPLKFDLFWYKTATM